MYKICKKNDKTYVCHKDADPAAGECNDQTGKELIPALFPTREEFEDHFPTVEQQNEFFDKLMKDKNEGLC